MNNIEKRDRMRRLLRKTYSIEKNLRSYLGKVDVKQKQGLKQIPLLEHKLMLRSFLALTECFENLLEDQLTQRRKVATGNET